MRFCDVAILGDTLSTRSCAVILQQAGLSVLVVPHGKSKCTFGKDSESDNGIDSLLPIWMDATIGSLSVLLAIVKPTSSLKFKKYRFSDMVIDKIGTLSRPSDTKEYSDMLMSVFPKEKENLKLIFETIDFCGSPWEDVIAGKGLKYNKILRQVPGALKMSFEDYLDRSGCGERLRRCFLAPMPRKNASLMVMSGFIKTQYCDGHWVSGGSRSVASWLLSSLESGTKLEDDSIVKIAGAGPYTIKLTKGDEINCRCIVSSYDLSRTIACYVHKQPASTLGVPSGESVYILRFPLQPDLNNDINHIQRVPVIHIYPDFEKEYLRKVLTYLRGPVSVFPDYENLRLLVTIRTSGEMQHGSDESREMLTQTIKNILTDYWPRDEYSGEFDSPEVFDGTTLGNVAGIESGDVFRWAFTFKELMQEPLNSSKYSRGIFALGDWGSAWFFSALFFARAVLKTFKKDQLW